MAELAAAADADVPLVAALMNLAYRGQAAAWNTESGYITGQRTSEAMLRADLAETPGARLMVLRDTPGGPLVASVWLEPRANGSWYLGALTVHPDHQSRKLGRRVLDAAEALARDQGGLRIRMTVVNIRETLIGWYERCGYRLTGETLPFPYGDARFGVPTRDDLSFVVLEKPL